MVRETGIRPHVAPVQVSAAYGRFTRIDFKGSHDRGELNTCHAKRIRSTRTTLGFLLHQIFPNGFRSSARTSEDNAAQGEDAEYNASACRLSGVHGHNTPRSVCEVGRLLHESCQIKWPLTQRSQTATSMRFTTLGPVLAPWGKQLWAGRQRVLFVVPPGRHRASRLG